MKSAGTGTVPGPRAGDAGRHGVRVRNLCHTTLLRREPRVFVLLSALAMIAADPWHLPGWEARAIVAIGKPSREPGMDAAVVRVLLQGDAKPNGDDLRVVDPLGKPLPFQVLHFAADRDALIAFRATDST